MTDIISVNELALATDLAEARFVVYTSTGIKSVTYEQLQSTLTSGANLLTGAAKFTAGATLKSSKEFVTDGPHFYYWTGTYPKTVSAGDTVAGTGGVGTGAWAVVDDTLLKGALASGDGFRYVGQVSSYSALKLVVPAYAGQSILLESYFSGWTAKLIPPSGGGTFVAVNGAGVEDHGSVAVVNDSWYWKRLNLGAYTPEMFGAYPDASADAVPSIRNAILAACKAGTCEVEGKGRYLFGSTLLLCTGGNTPAASEPKLQSTYGLKIYLNVVIVDPHAWAAVPAEWWNAAPAFKPAIGTENLDLRVEQFDGGGKATFLNTSGTTLSTSSIYVGHARNYIIMYKNFGDAAAQGTMNRISGHNWQDGYMGCLVGVSAVADSITECHEFDIKWCANHRYPALGLMDHTNYAKVIAGTYDYNGKWSSKITLQDPSSTEGECVVFGSKVTNGKVTGTSLGPLMYSRGKWTLLLTESADKTDGISDYKVGDKLTCGTWSATIGTISLCSAASKVSYFDMLLGCRTGDFDKSVIMPTYLGGWLGHNEFTNWVIAPNAYDTVYAQNMRGMGVAGGATSASIFFEHLYGENCAMNFTSAGMSLGVPIMTGWNLSTGIKTSFDAKVGDLISYNFPPATELDPAYYTVTVGSSIRGQFIRAIIRVGADSIDILDTFFKEKEEFLTVAAEGLKFKVAVGGSAAKITVAVERDL